MKLLGQTKNSPLFFFHKINIFKFSPVTFLIQIFWEHWLSAAISFQWVVGRAAAEHLPMHKPASQQRIIWPKCQEDQETSQTTFDMFNQAQYLLHTLHKQFFVFQLHFYHSWNNKAQYAKNVAYFLPPSIFKWLDKNSPILIFFNACCHNTI